MQTRKFFIKVLVRNESFFNVRTSKFEDMGYNLKKNGWLNNFVDAKKQSMREDGVLVKNAQFLLHHFLCPYGQRRNYYGLAMWRSYVLHLFVSHFHFFFLVSLFSTCFIFLSFPYPHLCTIGCTNRFRHCMPLHSKTYCSFGVRH